MNKSTAIFRFIESPGKLLIAELLFVIPILVLPLLIDLPYRINIFLSWEGSYRLYLGQVPFTDFGLPMGFAYWLIPTLFFQLFGPTFMSLVKAQVLINLVSVLCLRGLLYNLKIKPIAVTLALLIFCLTYMIYNFWPWYNHSVVVYELVALYFLTRYQAEKSTRSNVMNLALAGFFTFISFYTKQDVGALCFLICLFLTGYFFLMDRKWLPVVVYVISFLITAGIFIIPFLDDGFTYWFNLGQAPHRARISSGMLLEILLSRSVLEKIYLLLILFGLTMHVASWKQFLKNRNVFMCSVISVAFILQSLVTRTTSPLPTDHMSYFHTFAFVGVALFIPWEQWSRNILALLVIVPLLVVCFSEGYWKYLSGIFPSAKLSTGINTTTSSKKWVKGKQFTLQKIKLPEETQAGIDRILASPYSKKENLQVLNMSELTSLAYEIGYTPLTDQPLWYHLNIGMFQKEVDEINQKIQSGLYDVVLFEDIPDLNNFYPYANFDVLKENYVLVDTFLSPRKEDNSYIYVFLRPDNMPQ